MGVDRPRFRRRFLKTAAVGVAGVLAGCNDAGDTGAPSPTPTQGDGRAPTIVVHAATPRRNGDSVAVHMEGEDAESDLASARIVYGPRELARRPDGSSVTVDGTLEDTAAVTPDDGRVAFVLTDAAGNETRKHVRPDDTAPDIGVAAAPTTDAGEIAIRVESTDDTGLAEVHVLLDGEIVQDHDISGSPEYEAERTVTGPQEERGQRVPVVARARDWNGNVTEQDVQTYVRKFDRMEDTRLNVGAVYQPYLPQFGRWECTEGRTPAIGHYESPYPAQIFNRHIDQMTWGGVNRIMVEYLGQPHTDRENGRFLESDLTDQVEVEPFYTMSIHLWGPDAPSVDSYREDLLKPHMQRIRDQVMTRDNVSTFEGRPIVQMWNPVLLWRDYYHDIVADEWGGYNEFFEDMRTLLNPGGARPFLVGGTNWWGERGYPGDRRKAIAEQFDAVTTWASASVTGDDNYASQEEVYNWVERNFQGHREFVDPRDVEFLPMAFPGFNERNCREERRSGRKIPRSAEFFRSILHLAEEYRTSEFVNIVPYNNWAEGTQWEPGRFMGNDYGTAYLEVVEEFQTP